jgi:hypothetical protein
MQETAEKTLPELCDEWGIKLQLKKVKASKNASKWQKEANAWLAILSRDGYHLAVPYYTGKAIKKTTVADVVHCLASDHNIFTSCENLKGFGDSFGWDEDTANTWEIITHQAKAWEEFIGDAYLLQTLGECEY